jgi:hypothetical protein
MQAKASGKQTIWVLLIALVLIVLCIGGLWAYVVGASTETGIQEASAAEMPEEARDTIVYERYDEFPSGSGDAILSEGELSLLNKMQEAYAQGERPVNKAPALPDKTGFAIIPLDPDDYGGMTEYYILPDRDLTGQELLQLIEHGEEAGVPFTPETFTDKNSMIPGGDTVNRYSPAGESERHLLLYNRFTQEGLRPKAIPVLTFPVSGPAKIPLNLTSNGAEAFYLYPLRELTDEELLQNIYLIFGDNQSLDPNEIGRNAAADAAWVRTLAEDVLSMPLSVENNYLLYNREDEAANVIMTANFVTPMINGKRTYYVITADLSANRFTHLIQFTEDRTVQKNEEAQPAPQNMPDRPWKDIAVAAAERLTGLTAETAETYGPSTSEEKLSTSTSTQTQIMQVNVTVSNGEIYNISIRISDGIIDGVSYLPVT